MSLGHVRQLVVAVADPSLGRSVSPKLDVGGLGELERMDAMAQSEAMFDAGTMLDAGAGNAACTVGAM